MTSLLNLFFCFFVLCYSYPILIIQKDGYVVGKQDCFGLSSCSLKAPGFWDDYYLQYSQYLVPGYRSYQAWSQGLDGGPCANVTCNNEGYFCCSQRVGINIFMYSVLVNVSGVCVNMCQ